MKKKRNRKFSNLQSYLGWFIISQKRELGRFRRFSKIEFIFPFRNWWYFVLRTQIIIQNFGRIWNILETCYSLLFETSSEFILFSWCTYLIFHHWRIGQFGRFNTFDRSWNILEIFRSLLLRHIWDSYHFIFYHWWIGCEIS